MKKIKIKSILLTRTAYTSSKNLIKIFFPEIGDPKKFIEKKQKWDMH
jgi:hypothetical protein